MSNVPGNRNAAMTRQPPSTDGDELTDLRKAIRGRFTEVEIDLILTLVSEIPVALWAASGEEHDYAIRLWSPGAERLYGFPRDEVLGRNYIDTFVNPLERRQAIADHLKLEQTKEPYRNLARDRRRDGTTRLLLTQGIALWHPVLRQYMQGEITVDATEVPGKDRDWLEQVLTPEAARSLIERFTEISHAALSALADVVVVAGKLVRTFLGESADMLVFLQDVRGQLEAVGHTENEEPLSEFHAKEVARWCMQVGQDLLIVDYRATFPPREVGGRHSLRFPAPTRRAKNPRPFAVGVIKDDAGRPKGAVLLSLRSQQRFSELTEGLLSAICGTLTLGLAIEDKLARMQQQGSIVAKERERQATIRLARQYRHAVLKKANLLYWHAEVLAEDGSNDAVTEVSHALHSMADRLYVTGESFQSKLEEEAFDLGSVLSSLTGTVFEDYPRVEVVRDEFPKVLVRGVRPFIDGALENLILNAVEAMNYRGRLGVSCSPVSKRGRVRQSQIEIYICDDGPGMPAEMIGRWHEEGTTTKDGENRGYGLPIAVKSFEECGGRLELLPQPIEPWSGACWRVTLPVVANVAKRELRAGREHDS